MDESQHRMKIARTQDWYDSIWKTVGKCVFCDLKDKYILHEENGVVLTINLYPYIDGQMMAIPRRHVKSTNELTQVEWEIMRKFGYIAKKFFKKIHGHKAMWSLVKTGILAQGTVADHLHMHFIPFDKQDLCNWNFRELKYAPLENVELYKKDAREFVKNYMKFDSKYSNKSELPIVCDIFIKNKKDEFLFERRKKQNKIKGDILVLPGGHIDSLNEDLITGLRKEVFEETALKLVENKVKIINSDISELTFIKKNPYLKANLEDKEKFLRNTYIYSIAVNEKIIKPGDECEEVIWLSKEKVLASEHVSDSTKKMLHVLS
ncbi:MAG: NUDIX domain-containing protein [Candidatus Dojkabacteria bacterium]